jgi:hypothetical protein
MKNTRTSNVDYLESLNFRNSEERIEFFKNLELQVKQEMEEEGLFSDSSFSSLNEYAKNIEYNINNDNSNV